MKKKMRSNISDEDLVSFKKLSLKKKIRLLDEMNSFLQRFTNQSKAMLWEKIKRGELKAKRS